MNGRAQTLRHFRPPACAGLYERLVSLPPVRLAYSKRDTGTYADEHSLELLEVEVPAGERRH